MQNTQSPKIDFSGLLLYRIEFKNIYNMLYSTKYIKYVLFKFFEKGTSSS